MIIIKAQGGLGNQLFQYALYEALKRNGKEVKMDLTSYSIYEQHNGFELNNIFNINIDIASENEVEKFIDNKQDIFSLVRRKVFGTKKSHYIENGIIYNPNIINIDNVYLQGYWQTEKYFKNIRTDLLKMLKFKVDDNKNLEALEKIRSNNSVSIHVRRGDYINNINAAKVHGNIVGIEYYNNAVNIMKDKVENPLFVIFSDDIEWVKNNINIENTIFIDFNKGKDSYKDMFLMSKCKHNILANSSFSWWGAWLNENEKKIVVSPSKWMNEIETPDIWCDTWIKCEV